MPGEVLPSMAGPKPLSKSKVLRKPDLYLIASQPYLSVTICRTLTTNSLKMILSMSKILFVILEASNLGWPTWTLNFIMAVYTNKLLFWSGLARNCRDPTNCGSWYV
jgi:hypothetical protein